MLAGWAWEAVKEGFVRHDLHDLTFFGLFVVALCLARLPRSLVPLQAGAIALAALLACIANGGPPPSLHSPREAARALAQEVRDLVVQSRWDHQEAVARLQTRLTGATLAPDLLTFAPGVLGGRRTVGRRTQRCLPAAPLGPPTRAPVL